MTIRLGMQTVTAIDDGGISLSSNRDFFVSYVLSLEVPHPLIELILKAKRMKSKERTKLETTYAHAAQIFCEMLGQVCHGQFYENTLYEVSRGCLSSSHRY
jgi:hypothetical protein